MPLSSNTTSLDDGMRVIALAIQVLAARFWWLAVLVAYAHAVFLRADGEVDLGGAGVDFDRRSSESCGGEEGERKDGEVHGEIGGFGRWWCGVVERRRKLLEAALSEET